MSTAPPHYQHVLENLARYPIYDPATHKQPPASNAQPGFSRTPAPASAATQPGFSRNAAPAPSAVGHSSSSQGLPTSAAHQPGFSRHTQPADHQPALSLADHQPAFSRNPSASAVVSTGNHAPVTDTTVADTTVADTAILRVLSRGAAPPAAASWSALAPLDAPCSAPPAAGQHEEEESDGSSAPQRSRSDVAHLGSSTGSSFSRGRQGSPPPTSAHTASAKLQPLPRGALTVDSILAPVSEEERKRRLVERLMDDPMSYGTSSRDVTHAARGRDAQSSRLLIESIEVPDVKWHWEPDDGSKRWVPYDAPLCQKLERNFQLWIMAKSATCPVCMARRAAFPYDAATIESTFIHSFRPDVQWRFRFAVSESGKLVRHVQENTTTGSKRGIARGDFAFVSPDAHCHPPAASRTQWSPDASAPMGMRDGRGR